jgi:amidophosphoribosyltransferase
MTSKELDERIANLPPRYEHRVIASESEDHIHDECGVFGIFGSPEAAKHIYLGLYALQHRGQEGGGIVCSQDGALSAHRGLGLVVDIFKPHKLARVLGTHGIGHVRYSTTGDSNLKNVQPLAVDYAKGSMAIAHNGNLVNAEALREELEEGGAIFQSTTDSEVVIHMVSRSDKENFTESIIDALKRVIGAYSLVAMNGEELVVARDPHGFRPLWLGKLGDAFVVTSETCGLDIIDADWIREVEPGEVITINKDGYQCQRPFETTIPKQCIFEFIYVSRPDSDIFGESVDEVRKGFGRQLAKIMPVEADVVMAVPDSSNPAALGYSHESGIPFDMGFIRNHYVGRTFIEPDQGIRDFGVKIKLNPSRSAVYNKRIVLVDDSIVRGTTALKIIKMLKQCGAKEVHFRVASPPIINSCFYGIDTPNKGKLIAHSMSVEQIRDFLGVDSLAYITIEAMLDTADIHPDHYCLACFDNNYPTPTPDQFERRSQTPRHVDHTTEVYGG